MIAVKFLKWCWDPWQSCLVVQIKRCELLKELHLYTKNRNVKCLCMFDAIIFDSFGVEQSYLLNLIRVVFAFVCLSCRS